MSPVRSLVLLVLLAVAAAGTGLACGGTVKKDTTRARYPVLKIVCPVEDADIYVDETYIGEVRTFPRGMKIPPGEHRIEVRHDRYHSRFYELTLAEGERKTLEVDLPEALP